MIDVQIESMIGTKNENQKRRLRQKRQRLVTQLERCQAQKNFPGCLKFWNGFKNK